MLWLKNWVFTRIPMFVQVKPLSVALLRFFKLFRQSVQQNLLILVVGAKEKPPQILPSQISEVIAKRDQVCFADWYCIGHFFLFQSKQLQKHDYKQSGR